MPPEHSFHFWPILATLRHVTQRHSICKAVISAFWLLPNLLSEEKCSMKIIHFDNMGWANMADGLDTGPNKLMYSMLTETSLNTHLIVPAICGPTKRLWWHPGSFTQLFFSYIVSLWSILHIILDYMLAGRSLLELCTHEIMWLLLTGNLIFCVSF